MTPPPQPNKVALITGITGQDGAYLAEFQLKKSYVVHGWRGLPRFARNDDPLPSSRATTSSSRCPTSSSRPPFVIAKPQAVAIHGPWIAALRSQ